MGIYVRRVSGQWSVKMKRQKPYTEMDAMTKKRQKQQQEEKDMGLKSFDEEIQFMEIAMILNIHRGLQRSVEMQVRQGCLVRMAYFMVLSACTQISMCVDPASLFEMKLLTKSVEYKTAVSTMYQLVDLITAPIYSTQYKIQKIESVAMQACAVLCRKFQQREPGV